MTDPNVITLVGSPSEIGRDHGERSGSAIRDHLAARLRLATGGTWSGGMTREATDVLGVVAAMIPAHRRYSPELFAETEALAAAADISVPEALLVSGFTDIADALRDGVEIRSERDCTAVIAPSHDADGGALFAQTWDMHVSAEPFVIVLRLQPSDAPASVVFTTAGCLGQIGMNDAGIAIGITNLAASRGVVGVTWPFVVRKALAQRTFDESLECITDAPVSGGHNYLLVGPGGEGAAVESMPGRHVVERLTTNVIVRTNHCLDAKNLAHETREPDDQASSERRLAHAVATLDGDPGIGVEAMRALLAEPPICQRAEPPDDVATLGAVVADPTAGVLHVALGSPDVTPFEPYHVQPA